MAELTPGFDNGRPFGDGNTLGNMASAMFLGMPTPEALAMSPSQKWNEVSSFGVDELVNGFVGNG